MNYKPQKSNNATLKKLATFLVVKNKDCLRLIAQKMSDYKKLWFMHGTFLEAFASKFADRCRSKTFQVLQKPFNQGDSCHNPHPSMRIVSQSSLKTYLCCQVRFEEGVLWS